jgi:RNA polymerase sigma-54 factor
MRIGPSLVMTSRQTLAMTPQLQQAIKLLQFSHLELASYIQQELEKNPLLAEGAADEGPAEREAPPIETPRDTAEALAAAAPALADADDRWTREFADRGGESLPSSRGQRGMRPTRSTSRPTGRSRWPLMCWSRSIFCSPRRPTGASR